MELQLKQAVAGQREAERTGAAWVLFGLVMLLPYFFVFLFCPACSFHGPPVHPWVGWVLEDNYGAWLCDGDFCDFS